MNPSTAGWLAIAGVALHYYQPCYPFALMPAGKCSHLKRKRVIGRKTYKRRKPWRK